MSEESRKAPTPLDWAIAIYQRSDFSLSEAAAAAGVSYAEAFDECVQRGVVLIEDEHFLEHIALLARYYTLPKLADVAKRVQAGDAPEELLQSLAQDAAEHPERLGDVGAPPAGDDELLEGVEIDGPADHSGQPPSAGEEKSRSELHAWLVHRFRPATEAAYSALLDALEAELEHWSSHGPLQHEEQSNDGPDAGSSIDVLSRAESPAGHANGESASEGEVQTETLEGWAPCFHGTDEATRAERQAWLVEATGWPEAREGKDITQHLLRAISLFASVICDGDMWVLVRTDGVLRQIEGEPPEEWPRLTTLIEGDDFEVALAETYRLWKQRRSEMNS